MQPTPEHTALIHEWMPFATNLAKQHYVPTATRQYLDHEDLAQEAHIALTQAVTTYDGTVPLRNWIRNKVKWRLTDCLRDADVLGRIQRQEIESLNRARYELGDHTPLTDLAAHAGITIQRTHQILHQQLCRPLSLDATNLDANGRLSQTFAPPTCTRPTPEHIITHNTTMTFIEQTLNTMCDTHRTVFVQCGIHKEPMRRLAYAQDVSESRVSQQLREAKWVLAHQLHSDDSQLPPPPPLPAWLRKNPKPLKCCIPEHRAPDGEAARRASTQKHYATQREKLLANPEKYAAQLEKKRLYQREYMQRKRQTLQAAA